jgi:hypothetical protein
VENEEEHNDHPKSWAGLFEAAHKSHTSRVHKGYMIIGSHGDSFTIII